MKHISLVIICLTAMLLNFQVLYAGDWAVKIDDETISMEEFNRLYYDTIRITENVNSNKQVDKLAGDPVNKDNSIINKRGFLEHLIETRLLYKKCMNDKEINHDDIEILNEITKYQTVAQFYLRKKIVSRIKVTDKEINAFHDQSQSRTAIKQKIFMDKYRREVNRYMTELTSKSDVDDKAIPDEDLNRLYYFQIKTKANLNTNEEVDKLVEKPEYRDHPLYSKWGFRQNLIPQKLLFDKAMNDKDIDRTELDTIVNLVKAKNVGMYYLNKKIKNKIVVSEDEVNDLYNQNITDLGDKPEDEAKTFIRNFLIEQKSKQETSKYMNKLVSESKIDRSGFLSSEKQ